MKSLAKNIPEGARQKCENCTDHLLRALVALTAPSSRSPTIFVGASPLIDFLQLSLVYRGAHAARRYLGMCVCVCVCFFPFYFIYLCFLIKYS